MWLHILKDNRFSGEKTTWLRNGSRLFQTKIPHLCIHICIQIWRCHDNRIKLTCRSLFLSLPPSWDLSSSVSWHFFLKCTWSTTEQFIKPIKLVHTSRVAARSSQEYPLHEHLPHVRACQVVATNYKHVRILSRKGTFKRARAPSRPA